MARFHGPHACKPQEAAKAHACCDVQDPNARNTHPHGIERSLQVLVTLRYLAQQLAGMFTSTQRTVLQQRDQRRYASGLRPRTTSVIAYVGVCVCVDHVSLFI
jgi:hypothetical protein